LFFTGVLTVYTYFAVVFDRAIGGNPTVLGAVLVIWGLSGVLSNIIVGRLIDRVGSRGVLVALLTIVLADLLLVRWAGANLWTAIPVIILWGGCGWGILVPQQHRIVTIAPAVAPILLSLNNSATYLGATAAGVIGAAGLQMVGGHSLGYVGAIFVAAALITSELAARKLRQSVLTAPPVRVQHPP
jgi:predicted MFS family arabinose efflux permease